MSTFKTTAILSMLSFLILSLTVFSQGINPSNNYITKNVPVTEFNAIKLIGSSDLIFTQSTNGKTSVQIYGSDNLVDLLEVKVNGQTLEVRFKKKHNIISLGKSGKLQVIASSPSINSATLEGSGDIILNGDIQTTNMEISLSGSGNIKAEGSIKANTGNIHLQGSGDIKVGSISADTGCILLNGSGDIHVSRNCFINNLTTNLNGSGDIKITGINSSIAVALLQGSGDMELRGTTQDATIELNNSGNISASALQAKMLLNLLITECHCNCKRLGRNSMLRNRKTKSNYQRKR